MGWTTKPKTHFWQIWKSGSLPLGEPSRRVCNDQHKRLGVWKKINEKHPLNPTSPFFRRSIGGNMKNVLVLILNLEISMYCYLLNKNKDYTLTADNVLWILNILIWFLIINYFLLIDWYSWCDGFRQSHLKSCVWILQWRKRQQGANVSGWSSLLNVLCLIEP